MNSDDYVSQLLEEGQVVSSGHLNLDLHRFRSMISPFFASTESAFIAYWFAFAISCGADSLSFWLYHKGLALEFGALGPASEELHGLALRRQIGLRYLAIGVAGAQLQGYSSVRLETAKYAIDFQDGTLISREEKDLRCRLIAGSEVPVVCKSVDFQFLPIPVLVNDRCVGPYAIFRTYSPDTATFVSNSQRWSDLARSQGIGHSLFVSVPGRVVSILLQPVVNSWDLETPVPVPQTYLLSGHLEFGWPKGRNHFPETLITESHLITLDPILRPVVSPETEAREISDLKQATLSLICKTPTKLIPLPAIDWVTRELCIRYRFEQAKVFCEFAAKEISGNHPFICAIAERLVLADAILRLELDGGDVLALKALSAGAATYWSKLRQYALELPASFKTCWLGLIEAGGLGSQIPSWAIPLTKGLDIQMSLSLYRNVVRSEIRPDIPDPALEMEVAPRENGTVIGNYQFLRQLVRQKPEPGIETLPRGYKSASQLLDSLHSDFLEAEESGRSDILELVSKFTHRVLERSGRRDSSCLFEDLLKRCTDLRLGEAR